MGFFNFRLIINIFFSFQNSSSNSISALADIPESPFFPVLVLRSPPPRQVFRKKARRAYFLDKSSPISQAMCRMAFVRLGCGTRRLTKRENNSCRIECVVKEDNKMMVSFPIDAESTATHKSGVRLGGKHVPEKYAVVGVFLPQATRSKTPGFPRA